MILHGCTPLDVVCTKFLRLRIMHFMPAGNDNKWLRTVFITRYSSYIRLDPDISFNICTATIMLPRPDSFLDHFNCKITCIFVAFFKLLL